MLKTRLRARPRQPTNSQDLCVAVKEIWDEIPISKINHLFNRLPDVMQAVVDAEGGHTKILDPPTLFQCIVVRFDPLKYMLFVENMSARLLLVIPSTIFAANGASTWPTASSDYRMASNWT
jgi:hypothetical protein